MTDHDQFDLPDGYADGTEKALHAMFKHGEYAAAAIFVEARRVEYPAYGEYLAAKYAEELGR